MAEVKYVRKNTDAELENVPIEDGQLLFTGEGHTFVDFENQRKPMQNTPDAIISDSSTNAIQNKAVKSYVDNSISSLQNAYVQSPVLLWENNNASSSFSAGTINLSSSLNSYTFYEIIYFQKTTIPRIMTTGRIPVGNGTILQNNEKFRATADTVSGATITFEDAKEFLDGTTVNEYVIPYKVFGYK